MLSIYVENNGLTLTLINLQIVKFYDKGSVWQLPLH